MTSRETANRTSERARNLGFTALTGLALTSWIAGLVFQLGPYLVDDPTIETVVSSASASPAATASSEEAR